MYPEGSVYEGNLFYDGSFNKFGVGMQCFKNTKISQEEFGGPKGLLIDKFVGNFNHLETNWIYGDGILYFVDDNIHSLTVGATRSGKTRSVVLQTIGNLALAGESMILSDPKRRAV